MARSHRLARRPGFLGLLCLAAIGLLAGCGSKSGIVSPGDDDAPPPTSDATPAPYCTPTAGTNLRLVEVVRGLTRPVLVTAPAGDGRIFVVEKYGRIRIVKDGALLDAPFLDIQDRVSENDDEQGLLGLAFHPQYASNGKFYVFYTVTGSNDNRVDEYTVSSNPDVAGNEGREILRIGRYTAGNHNGGMLAFGPTDGYLYISTGDGGAADDYYQNGQNLISLHAKILRIDVDHPAGGQPYGIPSSNVFAGGGGAPETYVRGLRNPWRFSIDGNGDLYIGDVGQGSREEVDFVAAGTGGQNFGWSIWEGSDCFQSSCPTPLEAPLIDYDRVGNGRCSVIGGYVYRGSCMPDMVGTYFYGDYCSGELWTQPSGGVAGPEHEITDQVEGADNIYQVLAAFGTDGYGELYAVAHQSGRIYRFEAR